MKINWNKVREHDYSGLPRKVKKAVIGVRQGQSSLRKRLANVRVEPAKNGHDSAILSDTFCPKCGCEAVRYTGNMVEYPERYDKGFCARCGFLVVLSDNSPYYHALEFSEYNYEIE